MYLNTVSFYVTLLYKSFYAFTSDVLKQDGVNFGLLFFVVYIGKHPGCTPSSLTKDLGMDWGHSQRSIQRLEEQGMITKEKHGRCYVLHLTEHGTHVFEKAHQVFYDWDDTVLKNLNQDEKQQFTGLLQKISSGM